MQDEAIAVCKEAMNKHSIEKDIAAHIKKEVGTDHVGPMFWRYVAAVTDQCSVLTTAPIVRFSEGCDLALHRWPQLWQLCDPRDQALHLYVHRTLRRSSLQDSVVQVGGFSPRQET